MDWAFWWDKWIVPFTLLWGMQSAGFLFVLQAGRQPLISAPFYGLFSAVPFAAIVKLEKMGADPIILVALWAVPVLVGLHFMRYIYRGIRSGPMGAYSHIQWLRAALVLGMPFFGPLIGLTVAIIIRIIRKRDRLDHVGSWRKRRGLGR